MGSKLHNQEFGDRLRDRRKLYYKTQDLFSEALGVSIESVRNWEQGRVVPEMGTIFKIAELLDCDIDYLTGRLTQTTHDLQYVCNYTGLTEDTIKRLSALPESQKKLLCDFVEDPGFLSVTKDVDNLANKDSISKATADMIVSHLKRCLTDPNTISINTDLIEKSMLYTLSTKINNILCHITNTDL